MSTNVRVSTYVLGWQTIIPSLTHTFLPTQNQPHGVKFGFCFKPHLAKFAPPPNTQLKNKELKRHDNKNIITMIFIVRFTEMHNNKKYIKNNVHLCTEAMYVRISSTYCWTVLIKDFDPNRLYSSLCQCAIRPYNMYVCLFVCLCLCLFNL